MNEEQSLEIYPKPVRREFMTLAGAAIATACAQLSDATEPDGATASDSATASDGSTRVPLGLDGHSLRGMKWKATKLIEYAAEQRLDAVLLNNLNYFESLDESHLRSLRRLADSHQVRIYIGAGGICENAARFSDKWGDAEQMVATGIRVAQTLGSPVVNVKIGSIDDRFLEGGIRPRIDEAVRVLKASRRRAMDAGIRFGFENHAADLRSEELVDAVTSVGLDVCGVMIDPGNALWAMEDPMLHAATLAPHVVCNSLRDYMVWQSEEGATFQWTAVGDGLMDVPTYVQTLAKSNPEMPIFVESISNSARPIPFLTDAHWKGYPDLNGSRIVDFLKLCRRGRELTVDKPDPGMNRKQFEQDHQRGEFLRSIQYLREHCNAGLKS